MESFQLNLHTAASAYLINTRNLNKHIMCAADESID